MDSCDIFPREIFPGTIPHPLFHPSETISSNFRVTAVTGYTEKQLNTCFLKYRLSEFSLDYFEYLSRRSLEHDEARIPEKAYNWSRIKKRLDHSVDDKKNNIDVRLLCTWNSHHFLVKKLFSFGFRQVKTGTHHLIQLTCNPLVVFEGNHPVKEKAFNPVHQHFFKPWILEPYKSYRIRSNTYYMLVFPRYCYFTLHIISNTRVLNFETECPEETIVSTEYLNKPPPTPHLNDLLGKQKKESRNEPPPKKARRETRGCPFAIVAKAGVVLSQNATDPVNILYVSSVPSASASISPHIRIAQRIYCLFHVARNWAPNAECRPIDPEVGQAEALNLCTRDPHRSPVIITLDENSMDRAIDLSVPRPQSPKERAAEPMDMSVPASRPRTPSHDPSDTESEATTMALENASPPTSLSRFSSLVDPLSQPKPLSNIHVEPLSELASRDPLHEVPTQTPFSTLLDSLSQPEALSHVETMSDPQDATGDYAKPPTTPEPAPQAASAKDILNIYGHVYPNVGFDTLYHMD